MVSMNPRPRMAISKHDGSDCASEGARSGWNPSRRNEKDAMHKASPLYPPPDDVRSVIDDTEGIERRTTAW